MARTQVDTTLLLNTLNLAQRVQFLNYAKKVAETNEDIGNLRTMFEMRDRAYMMEMDHTAEKIAAVQAAYKGSARRKISDLAVPIVMPQVESAVAYQTGVYLTSHPIFGVAAPPKYMDQALQLESLMADHSIKYGWVRELIRVFRNGFKFNFAPTYVSWKKTQSKSIVTSTQRGMEGLAQIQQQQAAGNAIECIDPYNCFLDTLVAPGEYHEKGDYFGWSQLMNRMALKRYVASLDDSKTTSLREAFECGFDDTSGSSQNALGYYIPQVNPQMSNRQQLQGTNWLEYIGEDTRRNGNRINYRNNYLVTKFVCRALPSDFGRPGNTPTIFFGIIVNWKWCIYVEELLSPDDYLPVFIMQPNEDGLGYQTHSMLDTALPFQDMSSALWNVTLESKRRQVFDRLIYNERFINKADIDPASSVARIPLKNAAQFRGDDIGKAIYQIPYRDDGSNTNLQMSEMVSGMADQAVGQNKVDRGQFQKGNKTKTEFETTQGNSNSRQQLTSLVIEGQYMTPLKSQLKNNILLYQGPATIFNPQMKDSLQIDPVALRDSLVAFKLTDGVLPADKMFSVELLTVFMQTAQAMPVVMTEYDVMGMFLYWAKLKGANWLEDFKRDPQAQQQFLGNLQKTQAANTPPQAVQPGQQIQQPQLPQQ